MRDPARLVARTRLPRGASQTLCEPVVDHDEPQVWMEVGGVSWWGAGGQGGGQGLSPADEKLTEIVRASSWSANL